MKLKKALLRSEIWSLLWEYSSDGAHIKLSVRGIIHEKGFKVNPKMCEQVFPKNDLVYCNRHQVVLTFTLGVKWNTITVPMETVEHP